jgi:hypothetical protein
MLFGQVLQEQYHLVARVHVNPDRDIYVALDDTQSQENRPIHYILKRFWPHGKEYGAKAHGW